jgi:hypothetical protein
MTNNEVNKQIVDIITKVTKLGWVSKMDDNRYMGMADIKKMLSAILDPDYMHRIDTWVLEAEKTKTICKEYPQLEPRDCEMNTRLCAFQSEILGKIMRGEQCVFKEGCCPFNKNGGDRK